MMKRRGCGLVLAVWLILHLGLAGCVAPAGPIGATPPAVQPPAEWTGPFTFIQMTDPQFGMFESDKGFARETELFDGAVAAANRLRPAFVVITGDLVNRPGDEGQIDEFLRIAGKLDKSIPLYLVSGNHDVIDKRKGPVLGPYRQRFGADWYSFDHRGCHFVVLDTSIMGRHDAAGDDAGQLAWLKADLRAAARRGPKHIIVFQHHPLFLSDPGQKDDYHVVPRARRRQCLDLFRHYGVSFIFAGHLHYNAYASAEGVEVMASSAVGKPLRKDPSGFRIVRVYEDRIEHEYISLDAAPEKAMPKAAAK